jgi:predicted enzyme related to lactoylglutathione lyase
MPERTDFAAGTPCWVDLGTTDAEAAGTFYATIFGWTAEPVPGPDAGGYTMLSLDGRLVGALAPTAGADRPSAWQTYVRVDDADKTVEVATAAGGSVLLEPMDIVGAGRMAVLADPAGATIAVWQPAEHRGFAVTDDPGTYSWTELSTRDTEGAIAFYGEVFGWGHETSDALGMPYTEFFDLAGASFVHLAAGTCAAVGAAMLGARTGKYNRDRSANMIPGHNVPLAAAGALLMLAAWVPYLLGSAIVQTAGGHAL